MRRLFAVSVAAALLFVCTLCPAGADNPLGVPDSEYNALVALYNATDGPHWTDHTNWLTANTPWYGVDIESGHVTSISLGHNQLSGELPAELGNLESLRQLALYMNQLSGPIPSEIGNLTNLYGMWLYGNQLSGEIPASITNLTALEWCTLWWNALYCTDPAVLSFLDSIPAMWKDSQTVAPTNVVAWRMPSGSILVSWDEIAYNFDAGYYEVGYSQTPGGPYTFDPGTRTEDKDEEYVWVSGLDPNQPVYLVVRTVTLPHQYSPSTVTSAHSQEATPTPLQHGAKLAADNTDVCFSDVILTASFTGYCYIENEERTLGLRVRGFDDEDAYWPEPGTRVEVFGTMQTNSDGERYLQLIDGDDSFGTGSIAPLGLTNRSLGGGDFHYNPETGAGQCGVTGGTGLNNIGLLVRTTGACTYNDSHTFAVDDGAGVNIRCETPSTILVSTAWQQVVVTGISSMRKTGENHERLLKVTNVQPIVSGPVEGITGRWEAQITSGVGSGVHGMLLTQQGNIVSGIFREATIEDGQMSGALFTCSFTIDDHLYTFSLTHDGDVLSGTLTKDGTGFPFTLHRLSYDPVSPYVGRPRVLSATCDGTAIDVTWDRPVCGWDFNISRPGVSLDGNDWADRDRFSYDTESNTFHLALLPTTPLVPGLEYTVALEGGSGVDWHDPYGVGAWDADDDCYSFEFVYQP